MKQPFIITFYNAGSWDEPGYPGGRAIILAETIEDILKDPFIQNSEHWNTYGPTVEILPMKRSHATLFLPETEQDFSYEQILLHREIEMPQELEEYYADIASNLPLER